MEKEKKEERDGVVTPCVGVWIEIMDPDYSDGEKLSLPVWECGLKLP